MLLEEAMRKAKEEIEDLYSIYLHTPVGNSTAINFYEKNGFSQKERVPGYYKSLSDGEDEGIILEKLF